MIYFRANAVIFRNRSVPCANAKDECVFMILTPDIKADTDEELYRKCVKKFAEILKIKTEKLVTSKCTNYVIVRFPLVLCDLTCEPFI